MYEIFLILKNFYIFIYMRPKNKIENNKTRYIKARVTEKIKNAFDERCKKLKVLPSQRLRIIIEKELRGEIG